MCGINYVCMVMDGGRTCGVVSWAGCSSWVLLLLAMGGSCSSGSVPVLCTSYLCDNIRQIKFVCKGGDRTRVLNFISGIHFSVYFGLGWKVCFVRLSPFVCC